MRLSIRRPLLGRLGIGLASVLAVSLVSSLQAQSLTTEVAERELIALTNLNRTANGLNALLPDPASAAVARGRSADMATRDYFSHYIPPDNKTFIDIMRESRIPYRLAGENLEFNDASHYETVQYADRDFLNSPTHRSVLLNAQYQLVGTGVARRDDRWYYTVIFLDPAQDVSPARPPQLGSPSNGPAGAPPANPVEPAPEGKQPAGSATGRPRVGRLVQGQQPGLVEAIVQAVLRQKLGL